MYTTLACIWIQDWTAVTLRPSLRQCQQETSVTCVFQRMLRSALPSFLQGQSEVQCHMSTLSVMQREVVLLSCLLSPGTEV